MDREKRKTRVSSAEALKKLQGLPDDYLDCRDMMHAWNRTKTYIPLGRNKSHPSELLREMVCIRCGTVKRDTFSARSLERISTSYSHPAGYLVKGGAQLQKNRGVLTRRAIMERSQKRR